MIIHSGYSGEVLGQLEAWRQRLLEVGLGPDPPLPPKKIFVAKHGLPKLADYKKPAPRDFWEKFPSNQAEGKSWVNPVRLEGLARACGYRDMETVERVCNDLRNGADIGCKGECRNPSTSGNAPSAFEYPEEITDAIAGWVKGGIAVGPMPVGERPPDVKVSGIMCRPKPNGSVRIILNLSAPEGRSVNDGIDIKEFPATMSSTQKWLEVLNKAGRGALMVKIDWQEAYKHVHVRKEDLKLQWFSWLGMDFAELALIFGAKSSVGLYDRLAKVVLGIVLLMAGFPEDMVCQHLDDVCAAGPAGEEGVRTFEEMYRKVAEEVGVRLAATDDPDKAFQPRTDGTVLGVAYDTVAWTWEIPREKVARLVAQIRCALDSEELRQDEVWSLAGRIFHYAPLVPAGRFNINYIVKANGTSEDRRHMVAMSPELKRQLFFWLVMVKTTTGACRIPRWPEGFPVWTREYFTDAAGGTQEAVGRGSGGVGGGFWFFVPWGRKINAGVKAEDGKKLSRKLSALELVGPLVCVAADFRACRGNPVRIWVDNAGSIAIWRKGYSSSCGLCTTLVKAIATVAAGAGCRVTVDKITRRSVLGAQVADSLSKADFSCLEVARKEWGLPQDPAAIPREVLAWVANPAVDDELGDRILKEIRKSQLVLGYNC